MLDKVVGQLPLRKTAANPNCNSNPNSNFPRVNCPDTVK